MRTLDNVIELHDVTKVYRMGEIEVNALAGCQPDHPGGAS